MNQDQQQRWWSSRLAWAWAALTTNPLRTAFAAFILATAVVVGLTVGFFYTHKLTIDFYTYDRNFLQNILVEAHGMLLDILVIGIFILWLNRLGEKRLEIRRYREEIDDFRGWDSDEAGYRIAGNVRRLNRNGITKIELGQCHLVQVNLIGADLRGANLSGANLNGAHLNGAHLLLANLNGAILSGVDLSRAHLSRAPLSGADLSGADLSGAILSGADLSGADLSGAILSGAILSGAILRGANLSGAHLSYAHLSYASLSGANLSGANLSGANLSDADLSGANLSYANPSSANLRGANLSGADLSGAEGRTNEQFAQAQSLVGARMPDGTVMTEEVWEEFKKRYKQ
jgi:BTB/POZ domain-containing protein KCTD9